MDELVDLFMVFELFADGLFLGVALLNVIDVELKGAY
jgi:hypothetical protein